MTQKEEALQILKDYNSWRRDKGDTENLVMPDPKKIGEAIDVAISALSEPEQVSLPDGWVAVEDSLPDENSSVDIWVKSTQNPDYGTRRCNISYTNRFILGALHPGEYVSHWRPMPSAPKLNTKD